MASKLQRKLMRESRIRGLYPHAVWMYYKEMESAYREELKADYQLLGLSQAMVARLLFSDSFGFAHTRYMAWRTGFGERLLFHYPWRGKVRAKDIIVIPK